MFRVAAGILMTAAAVGKIRETACRDAENIQDYQLTGPEVSRALACGLPPVELATGISLLIGLNTRVASAVTGLMLVGYGGALGSALGRGIVADCGCFGSLAESQISWRLVARNAAFATGAALVAANEPDRGTLDSRLSGARTQLMSATLVTLVGGLAARNRVRSLREC